MRAGGPGVHPNVDPVGGVRSVGGSSRPATLPRPARRVPPWAAALLLGLTAAALVGLVLLAGRAGPLVAHPPTRTPVTPPAVTPTPISRPPRPSFPPAPTQDSSPGSELGLILAALGVFVVILLLIWLVRVLRRPRPIHGGPTRPAAPAPVLPVALGGPADEPEAGAGATDERTFDPRRAAEEIITVWVDLEAEAGAHGAGRRSASTPTEFLSALTDRFGDAELSATGSGNSIAASTVLLRVYQRARFDIDALSPRAARQARLAARALAARMGDQPRTAERAVPDGTPR